MRLHPLIALAGLTILLHSPSAALAASVLSGVSVSSQSPNSVVAGGSATYTVSVSRTNNGNLDAYLTVSGLPAGVTASFSPAMLTFTGSTQMTQSATLTLSTGASTPGCTYNFTITASDGGSFNKKTCAGTLMSSGPDGAQGILCTGMLPDGSFRLTCAGVPNQSCFVQATTNLASTVSWEIIGTNTADFNGMFTFIDLDAQRYPCRFYRIEMHY